MGEWEKNKLNYKGVNMTEVQAEVVVVFVIVIAALSFIRTICSFYLVDSFEQHRKSIYRSLNKIDRRLKK